MPTVLTSPIEFYHPDPRQPRKDFPEEELRLLGESLKKRQLVPLIARKCGMLVDGERRWRAAKLAGVKRLDAILLDDNASESDVREMQIITALHRADLTSYEVYCGFQEWLKAHPGATAKELATALDRSEASVSRTLSLSKCICCVQQAAAQGKLGLKDWYAISQVPPEQQEAMLLAKLNGASAEQLERMRRKPSGSTVRTSRVKCLMPSGVVVTLVGDGDGLTLDDVIQTLTDLLKEAKKANDQGLDSKTFTAVMKDKAKAG